MAVDPIAFLDPEPPMDHDDAVDLFVNREEELRQAKQYIEAASTRDPQRILAIVGRARVGKSHLLRVVEGSIGEKFSGCISIKITPGHVDACSVLRAILQQVFEGLYDIAKNQGIRARDGRNVLEPFRYIMDVYSDAIFGIAASVEVNHVKTIAKSLKRRLGSSFKLPKFLNLIGGPELGVEAARETADDVKVSESKTVVVNAFQKEMLSFLVGFVQTMLVSERPSWTTLLTVDDFDILHRTREGAFDPFPLMQELYNLCQVPGFYVLTTVREDTYFQHEKTFVRVAEVQPFTQAEHMVEAYRRRVDRFNGGRDPFGDEQIAELVLRASGRPGVFFRWVRDVFDSKSTAPKEWFLKRWGFYEKSEDELTGLVKKAAVEQAGDLIGEDPSVLIRSNAYRFLLEDYSSINRMVVDPIALSFLREQFSEEDQGSEAEENQGSETEEDQGSETEEDQDIEEVS